MQFRHCAQKVGALNRELNMPYRLSQHHNQARHLVHDQLEPLQVNVLSAYVENLLALRLVLEFSRRDVEVLNYALSEHDLEQTQCAEHSYLAQLPSALNQQIRTYQPLNYPPLTLNSAVRTVSCSTWLIVCEFNQPSGRVTFFSGVVRPRGE